MKYSELAVINNCLQELGKYELPEVYKMARNQKLAADAMRDFDPLLRTLFSKFADKDADGKIVEYKENGMPQNKISDPDKLKTYQSELQKLYDEEIDIPFKEMSIEELKGVKMPSTYLAPLLDVIFTEKEKAE